MFSLVRFNNGEHSVLLSKRVRIVQGENCIVKYTRGGNYSAELIDSSDAQNDLVELKNKIEQNENSMHGQNCSPQNSAVGNKTHEENNAVVMDSSGNVVQDVSTVLRNKLEENQFSAHKNDFSSPKAKCRIIDCIVIHPKGMNGFSTPVNNNSATSNQDVSNITGHDLSPIFANSTPESTPPSGFTDKLESLGHDWPDTVVDETPQNFIYDGNYDNLGIILQHYLPGDDVNSMSIPNVKSNVRDTDDDIGMGDKDNEIKINAMVNEIEKNVNDNETEMNVNEKKVETNVNDEKIETNVNDEKMEANVDDNEMEMNVNDEKIEMNLNDNETEMNVNDRKIETDENDNEMAMNVNDNEMEMNDNDTEIDMTDNGDKNDPSYDPRQSTPGTSFEKSSIKGKSLISGESSLFDNSCSIDIRQLVMPTSIPEKGKTKKHFCPFCKKLQTKFARHLQLKHKDEEEVKKFIYLPHKNHERKKIIASIRKKGDFIHNTKSELNTGILIVPRQRQEKSKNSAEDYVPCKNCRLFLSKKTIRFHYPNCDRSRKKGARNILNAGRRLTGYIHNCAGETLRRIVFPVLNDDIVVRCLKYDELIIQFGNKLCNKYTLPHQHDHIRAQLRLLGRFKLAIMALDNEIQELKQVFRPQNFDKVIYSLRKVAHWNTDIMWFETPAVAQNLTTLIKKCAFKLRVECIKMEDNKTKISVENFLLLWEEEVPTLINKKALEDQITQKRQRKVILPCKKDIKLLYDYLKKESSICLEILNDGFDSNAWLLLSQCTLILVQIFNRRRAGEIERLTLTDYQNKKSLNENIDPELYKNLSESTRKFAGQFVRLTLRGKLGRTVSILLSPFIIVQLETMLKFRKQAGVRSNNEYIFSKPHTNSISKKYLRACPLMRRFADDSGAIMPSALRGTTLRKHIATYTAMLDIEETQVDRLANFMGHHKDIHKNIYRVPVPVTEMTQVSRLLMGAIGGDEDDNIEASDEENSDTSDEEYDGGHAVASTIACSSTAMDYTESSVPYTSIKSKRRSTSPFGKTRRTKWSEGEKKIVTKHFGNLKKLPQLPTLTECKKAVDKYKSVLGHRTPEQLKTWIDNQRRAESRQRSYADSKLRSK